MSKRKKGFLLINTSRGKINTCAKCSDSMVQHVLHLNITWTNAGVYAPDMSRAERLALSKMYPKMCDEMFLCEKCYKTHYKTNEDYLLSTGQYDYTSVFAREWEKIDWVTLDEAVEQFS